MHKLLPVVALGWLLPLTFVGADAVGQTPQSESRLITPEGVAEFFAAAFPLQRLEHELAGAVVSVVYRGEVIHLGGYGWADIEEGIPADPNRSLFRIASISKTFVWTALMQLVERGQVSLDAPVTDYIDFDIPDTFDEPIRIWHLMTHTPGFEERGTGTAARTADELMPLGDFLTGYMPARVRPPGAQASYSNYGTALAGYVIEQVTGQTWSDYVDQNILLPLGMRSTNTQPVMRPGLLERHARSYSHGGGRFRPMDYMYFFGAPAGHISTTAADMAKFMLLHLGDGAIDDVRILQATTAQQMQSPLFNPHPAISPMLHGFYRSDRNGLTIFGHGGDVNGFHSNMYLFPDLELGVFVSFNSDPSAAARSNLSAAFVDHFFPRTYLRPAPAPADVELDEYAGEYIPLRMNSSTFERLTVLVSGVSVIAQDEQLLLTGGGGTRWVAVDTDEFTGLYTDRALVFTRSQDDVEHMIVGSPLGTFERVSGLDSPGNLQKLFFIVTVICVAAVLGWGYRVFRRAAPDRALPRYQVVAAWVHAALILLLFLQLAVTLMGDVAEFDFGVPPYFQFLLTVMSLNVLLGIAVIVFAALQWYNRAGSVMARVRYDVVAFAALVNVWLAVYFNYAGYPLVG